MYRLTTPKMYTRHYYIDEYYKLLIVFDSDGKWKFLPKLCISYLVSYAIQKTCTYDMHLLYNYCWNCRFRSAACSTAFIYSILPQMLLENKL